MFLCWVSGRVGLCASSLRAVFPFPTVLFLLALTPPPPFFFFFPQNQTFWGLISSVLVPRIGVSDVEPSLLKGEFLFWKGRVFPTCGPLHLGWCPRQGYLSAPPVILDAAHFFFYCEGTVLLLYSPNKFFPR
uniref:Uncharacterized protein n=1 Tax=Pipistrellus kuhlii TaxID=59472 RepID=A0A7J7YWU3_PIPKU|nr:hypothetical protein mPipKuh1_009902 [Pipistrellus kuhlii]